VQGGWRQTLDGENLCGWCVHTLKKTPGSLRKDFVGMSGIDLFRCRHAALEIVTEPDMRSSAEAVAYAKELLRSSTWINRYLRRQHAGRQLSLRHNVGAQTSEALGTRREDQGLNNFKFMQQAMDYRFASGWRAGRRPRSASDMLVDRTHGRETRSMRTKRRCCGLPLLSDQLHS
jgi:aspartyl-tRNA(Asn)/glutamyl-tRNA(Gln) amidotransferase subunit B